LGRGSCIFKQRDLTKAVKAVAAAGLEIARVEVDREGKIIIVAGKPAPERGASDKNEWDSE
jgi:hypothetical protein